jgi:hypothetical protein
MPIRPEFRSLYPPNWRALSDEIRFTVADGRCQRCARPHGATLKVLPDGRWFDPDRRTWRDGRGRDAAWPDMEATIGWRMTKVVLAAAHWDGNPGHNRRRNLRALCQRCHLIHDRPRHLRQRWITYRRRYAVADLFLGAYAALARLLTVGKPMATVPPTDQQARGPGVGDARQRGSPRRTRTGARQGSSGKQRRGARPTAEGSPMLPLPFAG